MNSWFECIVKYEKTIEEGKIIKVSESYLVEALTFTEAELRIIDEMKPFISGEFVIANIRRKKIGEMFFNPNADKWFRAKVFYISLDEEKGIEKKTPVTMMVQASDIKDALFSLEKGMANTLSDYEIAMITDTAILDVYQYEAGKMIN